MKVAWFLPGQHEFCRMLSSDRPMLCTRLMTSWLQLCNGNLILKAIPVYKHGLALCLTPTDDDKCDHLPEMLPLLVV